MRDVGGVRRRTRVSSRAGRRGGDGGGGGLRRRSGERLHAEVAAEAVFGRGGIENPVFAAVSAKAPSR
jgi:hypothetical protein